MRIPLDYCSGVHGNKPQAHGVLNRAGGGVRRGSVRMCTGHVGNSYHPGNEACTG